MEGLADTFVTLSADNGQRTASDNSKSILSLHPKPSWTPKQTDTKQPQQYRNKDSDVPKSTSKDSKKNDSKQPPQRRNKDSEEQIQIKRKECATKKANTFKEQQRQLKLNCRRKGA